MVLSESERTRKIRDLNDAFRRTGIGGRMVITYGVRRLGADALARVLEAVRTFAAFTQENDPYGEHDFGSFKIEGQRILWKIEYYDKYETYGSPEPEDPEVTTRVLTIMLACEY